MGRNLQSTHLLEDIAEIFDIDLCLGELTATRPETFQYSYSFERAAENLQRIETSHRHPMSKQNE